MRITPLGDKALRVQLGEKIDEATHARVLSACAAIEGASLPGVRELVPAYTTVTIHYDPAAVARAGAPVDDLAGWLGLRVAQALPGASKAEVATRPVVEVPVCYGGEFGPDLGRVAAQAGLSPEEVVERHAKAEYWVALVGFSPGFPYLIGLPGELATPRLARPRTSAPAGSVGIAGGQTGIYPFATPGGWNLIGRAALRLFDPHADPPARLRAGDRVKFRAITAAEFEQLNAES
ncbi:MAG: kinase inhibitor [Opitutus sp.]|nr:kinase inhibitor [Opitutus sp.]